jgi:hypothetical protein
MPRTRSTCGEVKQPSGAGLHRLEDRTGEVSGERRLQALVGNDGQSTLVVCAADHALHEVSTLACAAV